MTKKLLHQIYYAWMRWRKGEGYGCGRCHHPVSLHEPIGECKAKRCPCDNYSIERVRV